MLGQMNNDRRFMFGGFNFHPVSARHLVYALGSWAWLEIREGWRSWFRSSRTTEKMPASPAEVPAVNTGAM